MGNSQSLKILLVCFYFPPHNVAGSLRVARIAEHLNELGHDVKIIAAKDSSDDRSLSSYMVEKTIYIDWVDTNSIPKSIIGGQEKTSLITQSDKKYLSTKSRFFLKTSKLYKNITNIPDGKLHFAFAAANAAKTLESKWKPDIVYSSALPPSVALAGYLINKRLAVPWICEFRDLWTTNHYYSFPKWRKSIDSIIENKILKSALALATVSEPLAVDIRSRFPNKNVEVILNGADIDGIKKIPKEKKVSFSFDKHCLNIVYTGSLYKGKRDPSILFEAIGTLNTDPTFNGKIKVHFFGKDCNLYIEKLSSKYSISNEIICHGNIGYEEAILAQQKADLLLLLLWTDEKEIGVFTGKLFEYIASNRHILAIGHPNNVAVKMINERKLGVASTESKDFEKALRVFCEKKFSNEECSFPNDALVGLTRRDQSKKLNKFILSELKHLDGC